METALDNLPRPPRGQAKGKAEDENEDDTEVRVNPNDDGTVEKPINREPPMKDLVASFLTTVDNYDRNHGPIQHRLASDYTLTVDGLISNPMSFSLGQLTTDFAQHTVTCALQCAGNRRHAMRKRIKEVQGVDWFDAAVMNAQWEGPRLKDVLTEVGVRTGSSEDTAKHVQFASYGSKTQEDEWYGGSIPLPRAMDENMDVILAVKMNGEPLPARHGFPLRTIVPGVLGARSVKWLDRITISDQESSCFYQQHDYKILPPDATDSESAEPYWAQVPAMLDMPVNACVAQPLSETTIVLPSAGVVEVTGYAVPQGSEGPVIKVQVSGDEGKTWTDAELDDGGPELASRWSWVLWRAQVSMEKGTGRKIYAKATDRGGNTQTMDKSTWNLRGVAYNGYEAVYDLTVV